MTRSRHRLAAAIFSLAAAGAASLAWVGPLAAAPASGLDLADFRSGTITEAKLHPSLRG